VTCHGHPEEEEEEEEEERERERERERALFGGGGGVYSYSADTIEGPRAPAVKLTARTTLLSPAGPIEIRGVSTPMS